jgi:hypothetical protein
MITPIALIHATVYGMMDRGFDASSTSPPRRSSTPSRWAVNGARLGLTGAVAVVARRPSRAT